MRVVIQRVTQASVRIDNELTSSMSNGLLVLIGIEDADTKEDIEWFSNKIINLRIFDDANKISNLSLNKIDGDILLVSQFTLHANTKKGNRPSYIRASKSVGALPVYEKVITQLESDFGKKIFIGVFGANMKVALFNYGPVTFWIDSKQKE